MAKYLTQEKLNQILKTYEAGMTICTENQPLDKCTDFKVRHTSKLKFTISIC